MHECPVAHTWSMKQYNVVVFFIYLCYVDMVKKLNTVHEKTKLNIRNGKMK